MFCGCSSLLSLPDISKWNTSNVNNISYIFYNCSSLSKLPDISKWNLKKVSNSCNIFDGCSSLIVDPEIEKINNINVNNNINNEFEFFPSLYFNNIFKLSENNEDIGSLENISYDK